MHKINIQLLFKLLSNSTLYKLIIHFYTCDCNGCSVNSFVQKFGTTQANISKSLAILKKVNLIYLNKEKNSHFYSMDLDIKSEYRVLFEFILSNDPLVETYACGCKNTK